MAIRQGTTELLGVYLGATEVQNIYQGTVLLYTATVASVTRSINSFEFLPSGYSAINEGVTIDSFEFLPSGYSKNTITI